MSFTSPAYLAFLPACALIGYILPRRLRNVFLLIAGYAVYVCWEPAGILVLLFVTAVTWGAGLLLAREPRKSVLALALVLDLGALCFFKYAQFAVDSVFAVSTLLGLSAAPRALGLLLPVGVSFYAFKSAGYVVDVYRGKVPAERNVVDYALFVSFFPALASGPIDRADPLLLQLKSRDRPDYNQITAGFGLFLWGLFKKLVIADNLAVLVNFAYADVRARTGFQLAAAAVCYSVQIYCDFSAYTDMARGSGKLLGIDLMENFRAPYLAASVQEFWRRWHISLSTWFRDYLYFPLGGSRCSQSRRIFNLLAVFAVSGLWHGAAWTFVLWGLFHGACQAAGILWKPAGESLRAALRIPKDSRWLRALRVGFTFLLVTWGWILFRADSLADAVYVMGAVFRAPAALATGYFGLSDMGLNRPSLAMLAVCVVILILTDLWGEKRDAAAFLREQTALRFALCFLLIAAVLIFGSYGPGFQAQAFVYFKF